MKKIIYSITLSVFAICFSFTANAQSTPAEGLRIVFIRHAEKPEQGSNLTCQGLNRSLQLPKLLKERFGIPNFIFVPNLGQGDTTKHSRMFETIVPFAVKYNLIINTSHKERDSLQMAVDLKSKAGTIIVVWEHKAIAPIIRSLGISASTPLKWPDDNYDNIWIVTFKNGNPLLTREKEGLKPAEGCNF